MLDMVDHSLSISKGFSHLASGKGHIPHPFTILTFPSLPHLQGLFPSLIPLLLIFPWFCSQLSLGALIYNHAFNYHHVDPYIMYISKIYHPKAQAGKLTSFASFVSFTLTPEWNYQHMLLTLQLNVCTSDSSSPSVIHPFF